MQTKEATFPSSEGARRMVLRIPDGTDLVALILLLHGGGFQHGSPEQMADIGVALTGRGYLTAAIDYTLKDGAAPEPGYFQQALADVGAALSAVLELEPRADASRVGLLGSSAGAILAQLTSLVSPAILGAVSLSGHAGDPPTAPRVWPPAPMLDAHSLADTAAPFALSQEAQSTWAAAGGLYKIVVVPGSRHGLQTWNYQDGTTYPVRQAAYAWLRQYVKEA